MRFLIRADASREIGSGHVVRCLTLANILRSRGHSIEFVCRSLPGSLYELIKSEKFRVSMLPVVDERPVEKIFSDEEQRADSQETAKAMGGEPVDCVIVDHYGLSQCWQRDIRHFCSKIVVIDDIANRKHDCDVLIDQNYSLNARRKYEGLVPFDCQRLIGPKYALLKNVYAENRHRHHRVRCVKRVFVYFGGTDQHDLTGTVVRTLMDGIVPLPSLDVVIGSNYLHKDKLKACIERSTKISLHHGLPHLADLMVQADLAIGAGGATAWERLCLGLPSLVISVASNQEPAMKALSAGGFVDYLGDHQRVSKDQLLSAVRNAVADPSSLNEQSRLGMIEVDGLGSHRIAEQLCPSASTGLTMRLARSTDIHLYYCWANDPDVRSLALNTAAISWQEHKRWFQARLEDGSTTLLLLCAQGLPVGQIRFDEEGAYTRVSYSLDADYRGRKWGKILVGIGMHEYGVDRDVIFFAEVKKNNAPSAAILRRLGFVHHELDSTHNVLKLRFDTKHHRLVSIEELLKTLT